MAAKVEGMLSLEDLTKLIKNGEIETVIMGVTDPYGKLCGKRIDAEFFLQESHTNACNYLFACDMEMNPIPGVKGFPFTMKVTE
jgi:glutamine synthetase